jgi:flavin reductase
VLVFDGASVTQPLLEQNPPSEVGRQRYRDAMSRMGAAVTIITTAGPKGAAGFTASAVCSVSDDPPTPLICLNRASSVYRAFHQNEVLCVNIHSGEHEHLSRLFAGKTPNASPRRWSTLATGAPALDTALANFDCRVTKTVDIGTHDVFFCEVAAIRCDARSDGLFSFDRKYHALTNVTAVHRVRRHRGGSSNQFG